MIDFRYHLVSIVAVFLALAIGIVLGSTELQGSTLDGLRSLSDSLQHQLSAANAQRGAYEAQAGADDQFLGIAAPKLLDGMLAGKKIVLVTEPGAPSGVVSGIQKAAGQAGASITGTIAIQPKFNEVNGANGAKLYAINSPFASGNGITLDTPANDKTAYQQDAAQLIAYAVLDKTDVVSGITLPGDTRTLLNAYAQGGYLTYSGTPTDRATLAIIVTAQSSATDGQDNPSDQVLLALAGEFASASAATLVAGPVMRSEDSSSPVSVLRNSSVSSQVSSVDNADFPVGQISVIWALADQLQGGKPNSYGVSGASAVGPVPSPVPSVTPTPTVTPTPKGTGKVKKTVSNK